MEIFLENIKGCVFKENIYVAEENEKMTNFTISAISTPTDNCIVILLINPGYNYIISHLWTTSTDETVKIFFGENQKKKFFEFKYSFAFF